MIKKTHLDNEVIIMRQIFSALIGVSILVGAATPAIPHDDKILAQYLQEASDLL